MNYSYDTKELSLSEITSYITLKRKPKNLTKTKFIVENILFKNDFLLEPIILVLPKDNIGKPFLVSGENTLYILDSFINNKVKLIKGNFNLVDCLFKDLNSNFKNTLKRYLFRVSVVSANSAEEYNMLSKI